MAAKGGSDGREDHELLYQHNNSSETLSEGRGMDIRETVMSDPRTFWPPLAPAVVPLAPAVTLLAPVMTPGSTSAMIPGSTSAMTPGSTSAPVMMPQPTSMTPVTIPNVPGMKVNIIPGPKGARIDIRPFDLNSSPIEEVVHESLPLPKLGGSLFLGHLASYPSVNRLSHFIQDSLPLGPLVLQTSRFVVKSTGRRLLRPFHANPPSLGASQSDADQKDDPALRRLLLLLDATAAQTLRGIDHIVLLFVEADGNIRQWVISSTSQLKDLEKDLNSTDHRKTSSWAGVSDIIIFFGAVGFRIAVGAFDVLVLVAEWFFDRKAARDIEMRERIISNQHGVV